jgi:hypothetical protein
MVYVGPPLEERLASLKCIECGKNLGSHFVKYPEHYLVGKKIYEFERSLIIPDDRDSLVVEFDEIYD